MKTRVGIRRPPSSGSTKPSSGASLISRSSVSFITAKRTRDAHRTSHVHRCVAWANVPSDEDLPHAEDDRILRALRERGRKRPRGRTPRRAPVPGASELGRHAGAGEGGRDGGRRHHPRSHRAAQHAVPDAVRPRGHLPARDRDRRRRRLPRGGLRPSRPLRRRDADAACRRAVRDHRQGGRSSCRSPAPT